MTVTLRPATRADIPLLKAWDKHEHVQFSDPNSGAGSGWDWEDEIEAGLPGFWHYIGEVDREPTGFVQIIDPHVEPSQYWGPMAAGYRAIDIWIGPPEWLGRGAGTQMMKLALARCFAAPGVDTVLIDPMADNVRAHRFYMRCGFRFVERRRFGTDDCFVFEITRATWSAEGRQEASRL